MPVEILLKSKLVRETLKAKGYDLEEFETVKATVGQDLLNLLQKLADKEHLGSTRSYDEPEVTKMRRKRVGSGDKNLVNAGYPESNEVVRTLFEKIPEGTLKQTTLRRKRVSLKEEAEELGLDKKSG